MNINFRRKLYLFAIVLGFIPVIGISIFNFYNFQEGLTNEVYKGNSIYLELTLEKLEDYFHEREGNGIAVSTTNLVIDAAKNPSSENISKAVTYLDGTKESLGYSDIILTDDKGIIISCTNSDFIGINLSDRTYIKQSLNDVANWSDIFYSEHTGTNVMIFSTPVKDNNHVIGTINFSMSQEELNKLVHQGIKSIGESGDAYIVNEDFLLYTDTRLGDFQENAALNKTVTTKGTEMLSEAIKNKQYFFREIDTYKDYLNNPVMGSLGVVKFGNSYCGLVIEVDQSEAFNDLNSYKTMTLIVIILLLVFLLIFTYVIIKSITKPINNTNDMLHDISEGNGDLTKKLIIKTDDEFGKLANLFNTFVGKLRLIVSNVASNSRNLDMSSKELNQAMEDANKTMDYINNQITVISDGIQQNASIVEETTASIQEIASGSVIVSEESNKAVDKSHEVLEAANMGSNFLKQLVGSINMVQQSSTEMIRVIKQLNASSQKISSIVEIITGVSEQVNLLALNAAIEAARAGEHGKGFAVVAEEVRKLAEETKVSAEDITSLITQISSDSENVINTANEEQKYVNDSVSKINDTAKQFDNILGRIQEINGMMTNISNLANNQSAITNEMSKAMDEISSSTQDSAGSINEMTGNVQNQVAIFEEISSSLEELSHVASELKSETDKFKV